MPNAFFSHPLGNFLPKKRVALLLHLPTLSQLLNHKAFAALIIIHYLLQALQYVKPTLLFQSFSTVSNQTGLIPEVQFGPPLDFTPTTFR